MRTFSVNISGRVRNFPLPKNQPLIPLMEAVVNSIHAIEERHQADPTFHAGSITVFVEREEILDQVPASYAPVTGFTITDNGIGFTDSNLKSFTESDSEYKRSKGGKGVGRFSWLKAFETVEIDSTYQDGEEYLRRAFSFSVSSPDIDDSAVKTDCGESGTTLQLRNYLQDYQNSVPKQLETIALKILQHCLIYFLMPSCPSIIVKDKEDAISVQQLFKEKYQTDSNAVSVHVKKEDFRLLHLLISDTSVPGNRLYLCANNRLVEDINLEQHIVDLDKRLAEKYGIKYIGVLTGSYFDENVDMNRLSFSIPQTSDDLIDDVSIENIISDTCTLVEEHLSEYLTPIRQEKSDRILRYVTDIAPQYRHLLKHMPSDIARIKPNLSDDALDDELYRIRRKLDATIRNENRQLLDDFNQEVISEDEYRRRFSSQVERISDANKAELANYVSHRRVIIDLLEKYLHADSNGKYDRESCLHGLIYPMRKTADEIDYSAHNLWLIDERLSYSQYIASDIPLNNQRGEERPDILFLNGPVAMAEGGNDGRPYSSITIFELKKPMRNDYAAGSNPIDQMYHYVERLQTGKITDKNGRIIAVDDRTVFYLYAICDVTPSLKPILKRQNFTPMPDGLGYYYFNTSMNCYIEVLPFDKILDDAKKRNRILFEKLGL